MSTSSDSPAGLIYERAASPPPRGVEPFAFEERGRPAHGLLLCVGGAWVAWRNRCPHWNVPLDAHPGRLYDRRAGELVCSTHGARFTAVDGHCVSGPCEGQALERFRVEVSGGRVRVFASALGAGGLRLRAGLGDSTGGRADEPSPRKPDSEDDV